MALKDERPDSSLVARSDVSIASHPRDVAFVRAAERIALARLVRSSGNAVDVFAFSSAIREARD